MHTSATTAASTSSASPPQSSGVLCRQPTPVECPVPPADPERTDTRPLTARRRRRLAPSLEVVRLDSPTQHLSEQGSRVGPCAFGPLRSQARPTSAAGPHPPRRSSSHPLEENSGATEDRIELAWVATSTQTTVTIPFLGYPRGRLPPLSSASSPAAEISRPAEAEAEASGPGHDPHEPSGSMVQANSKNNNNNNNSTLNITDSSAVLSSTSDITTDSSWAPPSPSAAATLLKLRLMEHPYSSGSSRPERPAPPGASQLGAPSSKSSALVDLVLPTPYNSTSASRGVPASVHESVEEKRGSAGHLHLHHHQEEEEAEEQEEAEDRPGNTESANEQPQEEEEVERPAVPVVRVAGLSPDLYAELVTTPQGPPPFHEGYAGVAARLLHGIRSAKDSDSAASEGEEP
eukprot:gene6960-4926_t